MANFTEWAIAAAFIKMLNERPLDKITVREVADACGISRNTFYYHFHDLYDLLERLFESEEERIISNVSNVSTLRECFYEATKFALENKRAIYHVYNSISRDKVIEYMYNISETCMRQYIMNQCKGREYEQSDLDDLVFLYASMMEGAIMNIMREGMVRDPEPLIDNATRLLEGTVKLALENSLKR